MRVAWLTLRYSPIGWVLAFFGVVGLCQWGERTLTPDPRIGATSTDVFQEKGAVPNGRSPPFSARYWSSWSGSDDNRGTLLLEPSVRSRFSIWVTGYPRIGGNRIVLENHATGATRPLGIDNVGESWSRIPIEVPLEWRGDKVALRLIDDAAEWGGWMAVSEPLSSPALFRWWSPRVNRIAEFLLVGATLLVWLHAMACLLRWSGFTHEPALPLLAGGLTAIVGYVLFWAYFCSPQFGRTVVWIAHLGACALGVFAGRRRALGEPGFGPEFWMILTMLAAVGVFYVAALHAFESHRSLSDLAAHRFSDGLPMDNIIPQVFAEFLEQGRSLKPFFGDWLSSDRPPLQTAWILLLAGPARLTTPNFDSVAQGAAIWFQLLWVPAVWLWMRTVGATRWQAAAGMVAITPSGFLFLNSTFVWPKLGAAALVVGAFTLWFVTASERDRLRHMMVGGALAALGWLAHGGVAFALLPLVPLAAWRLRRDGLAAWTAAMFTFMVFAAPWLAYQKFHDPPGNRLVKWHLAGVIPPDDRGTVETLVAAYRSQTLAETWRTRLFNARLLALGNWRALFSFSTEDKQGRRVQEASWTFYSLGWWILGAAVIPAAWLAPAVRQRWRADSMSAQLTSVAWALATLVVWVALMFLPGSTTNHQGSYTVLLVLLPALALVLLTCHWLAAGLIGVVQAINFLVCWMDPPVVLGTVEVSTDTAVVMVLAVVVALGTIAWSARDERKSAESSRA